MPAASRAPASASTLGGRIFLTLFLLFPAGLGLLVAGLAVRPLWRTVQVYGWAPAECTVASSSVEEHPEAARAGEEFRFVVSYDYSFGGQTHAASTYSRGYSGSSDLTASRRLARRYRPGARVPCWVDPRDPAAAMLVRPSPWTAPLFLAVCLLFAAVGAGGIVLVWKPPHGRPSDLLIPSLASRTPHGRQGRRLLLGAALALFGFSIAWLVFGRPAARLLAARSWPARPCVVRASQVRMHPGGKGGPTYSVDILYSYTVDDHTYESNRYDFLGGSSSGRAAKDEIVARYPPGARAECYADPADPEEAVLSRRWSPSFLVGLLPLAVGLAGTIGFVKAMRTGVSGASGRSGAFGDFAAAGAPAGAGWTPASRQEAAGPESPGPLVLKPSQTRLGRLVALLFIAPFWNAITAVFVWRLAASFQRGDHDWLLALMLSVFVLAGLVLLFGIPYSFLALWNPLPHLTLGRSTLRLGDTVPLEWRFTGAAGRLRRLRIALVGREETITFRYRSSSTRREVFRTLAIVDTGEPASIPAGAARFTIPAGDRPSFVAGNRRVVWMLEVAGEIPFWPDVDDRFELQVLPPAERRAGWG
jgi:hypothetical protein